MKKLFVLSFLFFVFVFSSCAKPLPKKTLTLVDSNNNQISILAEIARTDSDKAHGYMGRKTIPDGTGMLFVWDRDQMMHFWMKNTPHPLSIAYIKSDGTICDILDMQPFSLADVASTSSARYALEVPQTWFSKVGIKVGDKLVLDF